MVCAAEGEHLDEGILNASGCVAHRLAIRSDDALVAVALTQDPLGGFVVSGHVDSGVAVLVQFAVNGIKEQFGRTFFDALLVVGAAYVYANRVG